MGVAVKEIIDDVYGEELYAPYLSIHKARMMDYNILSLAEIIDACMEKEGPEVSQIEWVYSASRFR